MLDICACEDAKAFVSNPFKELDIEGLWVFAPPGLLNRGQCHCAGHQIIPSMAERYQAVLVGPFPLQGLPYCQRH